MIEQTRPRDEVQPASAVALLGLQQVAAMLAGCVALPLLVGRALGLAPADVALLVNATLLVCGLATLVQCIGVSPFIGARLPMMTGVAFATLGPVLVIAGDSSLGSPAERLHLIAGSTLVAGALMLLSASLADRLLQLFPPVVRGIAMVMIGIVLLRYAVGWLVADQPAGAAVVELTQPSRLGIALLVLVAIVLIARFGGAGIASFSVLTGVAIGSIVACYAAGVSLASVGAAPWIDVALPLSWGAPRFALAPVATMCLAAILAWIETSVALRAASVEARGANPDHDSTRGLRADGLATIVAGALNGLPCASFAAPVQPVGASAGVIVRACMIGGVLMVVLSLMPKFAALTGIVPSYVSGGAGLFVFGAIAAAGIKILADVDYTANRHSLFVVALSLGIGLVPLVAPQFFKVVLAGAPDMAPVLQSSVILTVVTAVVLNFFFLARPSARLAVASAN